MLRTREDRLFERYRRRGDTAALAELFDRTAPEVWRVAAYLTRDRHLVEDAVQATFLAAIEHAARWDRRQRVVPWLLGILANQVRSLRRRQDATFDADRVARPLAADPGAQAEAVECGEQVQAALARVPDALRGVLERYLVHGDSPAEIAQRLGLRAGTARMRLQRGLAHLRRLLPAGFAGGGLVASDAPAAALAAVRRVVVARAARVPVAVAASGALGVLGLLGGIAMKKVLLGVTLAGVVVWGGVAHWSTADGDDQPPAARTPAAVASAEPKVAAEQPAPPATNAAAAAAVLRQPVPARSGTGSLRVRVVDRTTRKPVQDIFVRWARKPAAAASQGQASAGAAPSMDRTGADGECVFQDEAGAGTVEALGGGGALLSASDREHEIRAGAESLVVLEIDARVMADVVVLDADDQPLAGAAVYGEVYLPDWPWYEGLATTDALGRCRITSTFERFVFAMADGKTPSKQVRLIRSGRDGPLTLRLGPRAGTVQGCVLDADGAPVAGAVVALVAAADAGAAPPPPLFARTDGRGDFAVHSVPLGACTAFAIRGAVVERRWRTLRAGRAQGVVTADAPLDLVIRLARGAGVQGVVEAPSIDPARPVRVSAHWLERDGVPQRIYDRLSAEVAADAAGAFAIAGLMPGRYALFASDRVQEIRHEVVLADGEVARWNPHFAGAARIAVRVVDADGKPLANSEVHSSGREMAGGMTDDEGRFRFDARSDAAVTIFVFRGRHIAAYFDDIRPQPEEHELRLAGAHLPAAAHGKVVVEGGAPMPPGLRVQLRSVAAQRRHSVSDKVAADGSFHIGALPPDTYRIALTASGATGQDELASAPERTLAAGETCDLGTIPMRARGQLLVMWPLGATKPSVGVRDGDIFVRSSVLLATGKHEVLLWDEELAPTRTTVMIEANQETTLRPELTRATQCTFLFPEPIARCAELLSIRDAQGDAFTMRLPDSNALALRRGLLPGRYAVTVTGRDGKTWPAQEVTVERAPVQVTLAPR